MKKEIFLWGKKGKDGCLVRRESNEEKWKKWETVYRKKKSFFFLFFLFWHLINKIKKVTQTWFNVLFKSSEEGGMMKTFKLVWLFPKKYHSRKIRDEIVFHFFGYNLSVFSFFGKKGRVLNEYWHVLLFIFCLNFQLFTKVGNRD